MAELGHFTYHFSERLPRTEEQREQEGFEDLPSLEAVVADAIKTVEAIEQIQALPPQNQQLVLAMARRMLKTANDIASSEVAVRRTNESGLYLIGSRARGDARPDSDVDLLSAGTFFRNQGFLGFYPLADEKPDVFDGFRIEIPDELPDQYNIGWVGRRYMVRAKPEADGLPVDLKVADLTWMGGMTLDSFKQADVTDSFPPTPLPRIPLLEVGVAEHVEESLMEPWTATVYDLRPDRDLN